MKILEIMPQMSFDGGGERFVCDLCNELIKDNDVTILCLYPPTKFLNYQDIIDKKIKVLFLNKKNGFDYKLFKDIEHIINDESPDIVHTHLRAVLYLLPSIIKHHKKIHFLHTVHSDAFKEAGGTFTKLIRKYIFKKGYCTPVTISQNGSDSFKACYNMTAALIPNGKKAMILPEDDIQKEIAAFRKSQKTRILINVARIDYPKNQILLCRAFNELIKDGVDAQLLIVGGHFDHNAVNDIRELNCPNIHLLGIKKNPMYYMSLCDAFCLSSTFEGMPISLIEAFAVGLIPICTAVGGINDMIDDGVNGFLAKDLTVETYKNTLLRFFNLSDGETKMMKIKAKESFSNYTIEKCSQSYIKLMQRK